jgi:hypothetical protein
MTLNWNFLTFDICKILNWIVVTFTIYPRLNWMLNKPFVQCLILRKDHCFQHMVENFACNLVKSNFYENFLHVYITTYTDPLLLLYTP